MKRVDSVAAAMLAATVAFGMTLAGPASASSSKWTLIPDYFDPATGGFDEPFAINDSGWMTGSIYDASTGNFIGFLRDPSGVYSNFSVADDTEARGIDNNNRVIGYSYAGSGDNFNEFSRAPDGTVTWLANPGTGLPLDGTAQGVNADGDIVGDYLTGPDGVSGPAHGFILNGATFTDLSFPGATTTKARGINDNGVVVGFERTGGSPYSAFIDDHGVWTSYTYPGSNGGTFFEGINNDGLTVGQWLRFKGDGEVIFGSFLYDSNTGHVAELYPPDNFPFSEAFSVNNLGQMVVISATHAWMYNATAAPEPATWAMMLIGMGGLGAIARTRGRPISSS
jgi:hypothetical protein